MLDKQLDAIGAKKKILPWSRMRSSTSLKMPPSDSTVGMNSNQTNSYDVFLKPKFRKRIYFFNFIFYYYQKGSKRLLWIAILKHVTLVGIAVVKSDMFHRLKYLQWLIINKCLS